MMGTMQRTSVHENNSTPLIQLHPIENRMSSTETRNNCGTMEAVSNHDAKIASSSSHVSANHEIAEQEAVKEPSAVDRTERVRTRFKPNTEELTEGHSGRADQAAEDREYWLMMKTIN